MFVPGLPALQTVLSRSHWSFEAGVCRGGTESHPTLHHHQPLTHSQEDFPLGTGRLFFFSLSLSASFKAGGRSQAVVGKSRTTGSIYLTSVSSTIAKHHQRAAGRLQTLVSHKRGVSGCGAIQIDTRNPLKMRIWIWILKCLAKGVTVHRERGTLEKSTDCFVKSSALLCWQHLSGSRFETSIWGVTL